MALPIRRSLPSLSEITSPSAGFPKTLDFTGKHPIVSVQNSRPRFDNDPGHRNAENVERPTSNVQYRMQKFIGRSAFGVGRSAFRNASAHAIFNRSARDKKNAQRESARSL